MLKCGAAYCRVLQCEGPVVELDETGGLQLMQCGAKCCSVLQCVAVKCTMLHGVAVCCSVKCLSLHWMR